jgi:hypothetical protein
MTLLLLFVACAQPHHLQYDFGRAYWESAALQADLSRASVAQSIYPLSGEEGVKLRENVVKASTNEETGKIEKEK